MSTRIAFRSTRGEGRFAKPRWTELEIEHDPTQEQPFLSTSSACSSVAGEETRTRSVRFPTLNAAIGFFDDTPPGRSIAEQARVWAERVGHVDRAPGSSPERQPFSGTTTREALDFVLGPDWSDRRGVIRRIGEALGVPDRTVRHAIDNESEIKVPLPVVVALLDQRALDRLSREIADA